MHGEDSDMIRQAFKQVGLGLPVDGSQNHKIKIKHFPEVLVGNWMDWQPTKGEGDELHSNLTPEVERLASEIDVDGDDGVADMDETNVVDVENFLIYFIRGVLFSIQCRDSNPLLERYYIPGVIIVKGRLICQLIRQALLS